MSVTVSDNNDDESITGDIDKEKFAKAVQVDTLNYDGGLISNISGETDPNDVFDNSSANPYESLYDLANNADGDDDLSNHVDPGDGTDFKIGLSLHEDAGNDFQGEGVDVTFEFMLNQQDGQ